MHKYPSALNYYKELQKNHENYLLSQIYSFPQFSQKQKSDTLIELKDLDISEEEKFYYSTSLSCFTDFHACKLRFSEYFFPQIESISQNTSNELITFTPLLNIKNAIENYRNFQLDDVHLKNAYILGAWYQDNMYSLVTQL
jgi:hypothetical protein